MGRDRNVDVEARRGACEGDCGTVEGRGEGCHAQSVVLRTEWQGRRIGKMLMAEEEGVVGGLEASEPGERMYRKLGFELLGRFEKGFGEDE